MAGSNLYDRQWRKRRLAQLQAEPLCRMCMDLHGRVTQASVADHVVPHRGDPVLFAGALQSLCTSCHSSLKQQVETSGRMRGSDASGMPLDPGHPWKRGGGG